MKIIIEITLQEISQCLNNPMKPLIPQTIMYYLKINGRLLKKGRTAKSLFTKRNFHEYS